MTRRPWSTSASIIPDRPQLSAWSAPNPWSSNTSGPAPRAVYAMRAPSNDATESGMKGTLRCADELGRQRVEIERVGVGDREQRDAAQRADEQRGVGDGIDVAPDLAPGDALAHVMLDHRPDIAVEAVHGGKERRFRAERFAQQHARGTNLELRAAQAVDVDPQPDEERGQPLPVLERGLEQTRPEPLHEIVGQGQEQPLLGAEEIRGEPAAAAGGGGDVAEAGPGRAAGRDERRGRFEEPLLRRGAPLRLCPSRPLPQR